MPTSVGRLGSVLTGAALLGAGCASTGAVAVDGASAGALGALGADWPEAGTAKARDANDAATTRDLWIMTLCSQALGIRIRPPSHKPNKPGLHPPIRGREPRA